MQITRSLSVRRVPEQPATTSAYLQALAVAALVLAVAHCHSKVVAAGGTNGNAGGVTIDTGTATGSGTLGTIALGTTNAGTISIGMGRAAAKQFRSENSTGTGTTTIAVRTTNIQSKNDTTITTNGTQQARFSGTSNTLYLGNANASGQATTANTFTTRAPVAPAAMFKGSLTLPDRQQAATPMRQPDT